MSRCLRPALNIPNGAEVFNQGGNYILDTYYTPLEESHRELVEVLQKYVDCDDLYNEEDCRAARTALSNAKKLINERP